MSMATSSRTPSQLENATSCCRGHHQVFSLQPGVDLQPVHSKTTRITSETAVSADISDSSGEGRVDAFRLRDELIREYGFYVSSFVRINDPRVSSKVHESIDGGALWPAPLIQLNPQFEPGHTVDELVEIGTLHPECRNIFSIRGPDRPATGLRLYKHQEQAIEAAQSGANYVLTTGTGSGKSLAYFIPIIDSVLKNPASGRGKIKAIVVYPMNALANSQKLALEGFLEEGYPNRKGPVTFKRYTGQESDEEKRAIIADPPDILLTNYVMLELILTRPKEQQLVAAASGSLRFLVFDELHTYRGRQGADVALLIRRAREYFECPDVQIVGTSATLAGSGTLREQQVTVANLTETIFGTPVNPDNVIGETLQRVTSDTDIETPDFKGVLKTRLIAGSDLPSDLPSFSQDPLAIWLESTFGVSHSSEGRLIRAVPIPIKGDKGAAKRLSDISGLDEGSSAETIRQALFHGNRQVHIEDTNHPAFVFKLHQFISPSGTVFASLEPEDVRHITLHGHYYSPDDTRKVLFPLAFCRECGQEYYCVRLQCSDSGGKVVPREIIDRSSTKEDGEAGYLFLDSEEPWPADPTEAVSRLPEEWLKEDSGRLVLPRERRFWAPAVINLDPDGTQSGSGKPFAFMPIPFRFCPKCGVSYSTGRRSDYDKLTSLGTEGRSTATTILSIFTILKLQEHKELEKTARKLLSFSDNRQDASLQAGHFNDFVQTGFLRASVYSAAKSAGAKGLSHDSLSQAVVRSMGLRPSDYCQNPHAVSTIIEESESALRGVIAHRVYRDLERGWRVNSPNLEQCGLLQIEYEGLDELCNDAARWQGVSAPLAEADADLRKSICTVLLDHARRELAIAVDCLDRQELEQIRRRSQQHLVDPWVIDEDERLDQNSARILLPRAASGEKNKERTVFLSSRGNFGKYLTTAFGITYGPLNREEKETVIADLVRILYQGGFLQETAYSRMEKGYRVKASAMKWKAGDGSETYYDPVRTPKKSTSDRAPNAFFKLFYTEVAKQTAALEAREHTAQVPQDIREEREERFRDARLPVMYCSPTMELGVDIAQLNLVNMRNIPPTPANYAQRGGRAGRGGDPAFVFTYCGKGSPHDQYFFGHPDQMVAGAVKPPRVDLANEELVRSHIHAIWLKETGISLGDSLKTILDLTADENNPKIQDQVIEDINSPRSNQRALERSRQFLKTLMPYLEKAWWYSPDWLEQVLAHAPSQFEEALTRWKDLYRAAISQIRIQNDIVMNPTRFKDHERAKRIWAEAVRQRDLLVNESSTREGDFSSYRYFASEGFLPGYNFPRLPLSAYVPGRRSFKKNNSGDDYLSRPRFLAITEFGPRAVIYHEGSKYVVERVSFIAGESGLDKTSAKICPNCGFYHPAPGGSGADLCEHCGETLTEVLNDLIRLRNVVTRRRENINADEEERLRMGYDIRTALRFVTRHGKQSFQSAVLNEGEKILARITYGQSAQIWRINMGWKKTQEKGDGYGFFINSETGQWVKSREEDEIEGEDEEGHTTRVVPFVEDTRNCLIFSPTIDLDTGQLLSLQSALKTAIQVVFQLEDGELEAEPLPLKAKPKSILFFESSEGGAGALTRLFKEQGAFSKVCEEALRICHFDPETGEDLEKAPGAEEKCGKACYSCLLSYRNQKDHELLDRHGIKDVLMRFGGAVLRVSPGAVEPEEHFQRLMNLCQSNLERKFLSFLRDNLLLLPDEAQLLLEKHHTRPDFSYTDKFAHIYVDGPDHDTPHQRQQDTEIDTRLADAGFTVIRFRYDSDWKAIAAKHRSVFGEVK